MINVLIGVSRADRTEVFEMNYEINIYTWIYTSLSLSCHVRACENIDICECLGEK